ncbi:MAG: ABC transporter permease [Rhodobacteraceae bacterium]|jgi:NitT/TauT family transport system permease protein|nr:ABC transporter permease [Paracoccaceae bacterium]
MAVTDAGQIRAKSNDATPVVDAEEARRIRLARRERTLRWALPLALFVGLIALWQWYVTAWEIPHYRLPGPFLVIQTLVNDFASLAGSWWSTVRITVLALILAIIGGGGLAILFTQSRLIEMSLFPYMVVLQVTPIIAIAPLIFIYIDSHVARVLFIAWIVAFFPVLSNTALGLKSSDHNLRDLMTIYRASRWQRLRFLQLPSSLPYFLGGLRIAGGLSLIGAVVAEFTMGSGGQAAGLAFRILESSYRLNVPRMFAALVLVILTGIAIYLVLSWVSWFLLHKWHESALKREG